MALTSQQELFCVELVRQKFNATVAYQAAYPKSRPAAAQTSASRLLSNAMIQERVSEITRAAATEEGITPQRVLRELGFIAFQRNSQVYRPDGSLKAPSEWDEATDATIAGIETEEQVEVAEAEEERDAQPHGGELKRTRATRTVCVRTRKVKRWDKPKALELFLRHFGLLKEDAPHPDRVVIDLSKLTDDALDKLESLLAPVLGAGHVASDPP